MKIEIGESLLLSWLRHCKNCQLVQTNWKPSVSSWGLSNEDEIENLMAVSSECFRNKYGVELYKKNSSFMQLLQQAEIDIIGMSISKENEQELYAIDVAFHEGGLNYGDKKETATRVVKKVIRTAMCLYGYFNSDKGEIIFSTPKVHNSVLEILKPYLNEVRSIFEKLNFHYNVRFIANDNFAEKILEPVIASSSLIADTSELFMRSIQMYNMFARKRTSGLKKEKTNNIRKFPIDFHVIDSQCIDGLEEIKIGIIVRTVFRKILEEGKASKEEITKMQTREYSKETFDIQYPLLQKAELTNWKKPQRYYATPLKIYGEEYFLCSEWYEGPVNNDRPYLIKWLELHK